MTYQRLFTAVVLLLWFCLPGMAAVRLAAPFGEHMVLQQGVPVPIWGTGAPGGDTVRLSFNGQNVIAHSDWAGRWMVVLAPMKAGGPYQMLIEVGGLGPVIPSSAANSRGGAELNDVVVGELRVMPLHPSASMRANGEAAKNIASGNTGAPSAWLRVFKSPPRLGDESQSGQWSVNSIDSAVSNSAAAYAYARELYNQLHVPIGVIESTAGSASAFNR